MLLNYGFFKIDLDSLIKANNNDSKLQKIYSLHVSEFDLDLGQKILPNICLYATFLQDQEQATWKT